MNKQQTLVVFMVASISLVLFVGIAAIAVLRRHDSPGLKISIKAVVIALLLIFSVIIFNVIMLGLNEG